MGALAGPADSGGSSLEKPEFLCVVSLHAAVLVVPVVPGRLGDLARVSGITPGSGEKALVEG